MGIVTEQSDAGDAGHIGLVLAAYGRGALVDTGDSAVHCLIKGRRLRVVCGDVVEILRGAGGDCTIGGIGSRHNLLERIDARGRPEPVAANVDRLAIVIAPQPEPDWYLIDRYWAAARMSDIPALLVVNKADLGLANLQPVLHEYRSLALPCHETSAATSAGISELRAALDSGATLLVGQSGVGKSSLVNALVPQADAQTAALTRDAEGRHTTTTARRYRLDARAAIVDAPGVRDFAPPARFRRSAEYGFVEIHALAANCRFNDCRHLEEPGCAVCAAVAAGRIDARRHESYRRLLRLYERLATH